MPAQGITRGFGEKYEHQKVQKVSVFCLVRGGRNACVRHVHLGRRVRPECKLPLAYIDAVAMGESDCIDIDGTPTISTVYDTIHYPTFWWVNTLTRCNLP